MAKVIAHVIPPTVLSGRITSPDLTMPANMVGEVIVSAQMATVDYENPAVRLVAELWQQDARVPGGWRLRTRGAHNGGQYIDDDGNINPDPILFSLGITETERGSTFKVEIDVSTSVRVGFTVSRMER